MGTRNDLIANIALFVEIKSLKQGGLDSTMTSFDGIPATNIWGQAKKSLFNNAGAVAVRGEMDTAVPEVVKFNVKVNDFNTNSEVQLAGNNGTHFGGSKTVQTLFDI